MLIIILRFPQAIVAAKNPAISKNIHDVFHEFLSSLTKAGYGVVFIPQLYGNGNDYDLMRTFCCDTNDYFVVTASDERYDTYFQQYHLLRIVLEIL